MSKHQEEINRAVERSRAEVAETNRQGAALRESREYIRDVLTTAVRAMLAKFPQCETVIAEVLEGERARLLHEMHERHKASKKKKSEGK